MSTVTVPLVADLDDVLAGIGERAAAVDRSEHDPVEDLRLLAEHADLFDVEHTPLPRAAAVIEAVSRQSLAVGFLAWAHRMATEYLAMAAPSPLTAERLADLVAVRRRGVTAMAAGQRQAVGLGDAPVTATPDGAGGYRLDGTVAWASNVTDDAVVVLVANVPDDGVRVVALDARDLTLRPAPKLLALDATASGMLVLDGVAVPADAVIGTDLERFIGACRPRFLLLQSSFCSGVAGVALDGATERLTGTSELYAEDHTALSTRYATAREDLHAFAATEAETPGATAVADLLRLRLELADLATSSTRLGLNLEGGRGYATSSAANRRFREASFLPIQSPSESQLRWELARVSGPQR